MVNLCICNNCTSVLIDTNPQINALFYSGNISQLNELVPIKDMKACPNCLTDAFLSDDVYDLPEDIFEVNKSTVRN